MSAYSSQWSLYRRLRYYMLAAAAAGLAFVAISLLSDAFRFHFNEYIGVAGALLSVGAMYYWLLNWDRFRCPRCANYFHRRPLFSRRQRGWSQHCVHCDLKLYDEI
jgi:hypothetical protein